jgi:hypothetical protein
VHARVSYGIGDAVIGITHPVPVSVARISSISVCGLFILSVYDGADTVVGSARREVSSQCKESNEEGTSQTGADRHFRRETASERNERQEEERQHADEDKEEGTGQID